MKLLRVVVIAAVALSVSSAGALPGAIQLISASSTGEQANAASGWAQMSADARYVVFLSGATNLVPGDTNAAVDVFVHNRVTGTTERVSISSGGQQLEGGDLVTSGISSDGRYVVFTCGASSLVPGDHNREWDVFVRDRVARTTERVSIGTGGEEGDCLSASMAISGEGRYVAFASCATNLVPGDSNGEMQILVRDRAALTTARVSVSGSGEQGDDLSCCPSISADGRYVAFVSPATNLVAGDSNDCWDIFVRDQTAGTTELISVNGSGQSGNADSRYAMISRDGRYVLFTSWASDLVSGDTNDWWDVFLRDRVEGTTERVSVSSSGEEGSRPDAEPDLSLLGGTSDDGRYAVFHSDAVGIVPGDTNDRSEVFLRDRVAGTTELVSVSVSGESAFGYFPSISADGRCIAFESTAEDLVPSDSNDCSDIFVRDLDARFHDVPRCFWAFGAIEACVNDQIIQGYHDNTYRPKSAVTRGQMAVYVARTLCGGDANVPDPECTAAPFTDVACDHWARKHIVCCVDAGVVAGYEDGSYQPDEAVSRDQMAVYIARAMAGGEDSIPEPGCSSAPFPDVPCDFWARKHVQYILSEGVTQGYPDGRYHPYEIVARDQMAVYIARAFELGG